MSWTDTLKKLTGTKNAAEQAVAQLQEELATARETIAVKRAELERARTALWPKAELIAEAERLVDETGQAWAKDYTYSFLQRLAGRLSNVELAGGTTTFHPGYAELPFSAREAPPFAAMCYFRASEWKEAFRAAITRASYEPGTARADRPAQLERLARELADVEALEENIVDSMAASGITVAHRPEVVVRRDSEARKAELADKRRQDAAWLEEQMQAGRFGTPRVVNPGGRYSGPPRSQA